jgi:hypothetical protein
MMPVGQEWEAAGKTRRKRGAPSPRGDGVLARGQSSGQTAFGRARFRRPTQKRAARHPEVVDVGRDGPFGGELTTAVVPMVTALALACR